LNIEILGNSLKAELNSHYHLNKEHEFDKKRKKKRARFKLQKSKSKAVVDKSFSLDEDLIKTFLA
jgi:hypothetical protein